MSPQTKRKKITPKIKLQVFAKDNYTCQSCGRSPITHHVLSLEVDHTQPFSRGGADDLSNYQTLCLECNRGKGNDESLNRTLKNELNAILNFINPQILKELEIQPLDRISVVANQEDYVMLTKKNSHGPFYTIEPSTNSIFGDQACRNLGIYTVNDNGGSKVHFFITCAIPS